MITRQKWNTTTRQNINKSTTTVWKAKNENTTRGCVKEAKQEVKEEE